MEITQKIFTYKDTYCESKYMKRIFQYCLPSFVYIILVCVLTLNPLLLHDPLYSPLLPHTTSEREKVKMTIVALHPSATMSGISDASLAS